MPPKNIDNLYDEIILDHCRKPRNGIILNKVDIESTAINPFCGDEVQLQFELINSDHISNIFLNAIGCSINKASASILSEAIKGKSLKEVAQISKKFRMVMTSDDHSNNHQLDGDQKVLLSVKEFPIRIKCALLSCNAIDSALKNNSTKKN